MKKILLRIDDEGKYKSDEHPILSNFLNISTSIGKKIIPVEKEAVCSICHFKEVGTNKKNVEDTMAGHLMENHFEFLQGDILEHKFERCPVCYSELNMPLDKCPNCGADLVKQRAIFLARTYTR